MKNKMLVSCLALASAFCIAEASFADERVVVNAGETKEITQGLSNVTHDGSNGGAIYNAGTLYIKGGEFKNNKLTGTDVFGGAIYSTGTAITEITGATFEGNESVYIGAVGAGFKAIQTVIKDTIFTGNKAQETGALGLFSKGSLTNVQFIGNEATSTASNSDGAGALFLGAVSSTTISADDSHSISYSIFKNNTSAAAGGAIGTRKAASANNQNASLDISNSTFEGNKAATTGGAIDNHFYKSSKGDYVNIENSKFINNEAGNGGAIYNHGELDKNNSSASMLINGGEFTGNKATGNGGAIYNASKLVLDATAGDITFANNTAAKGSDVYMDAGSTMTLQGSKNITFGGSIANSASTDASSAITNNSTGVVNLNGDNSGYTGTYAQTAGTTNVAGKFFGGTSTITNSAINFLKGSTVDTSKVTYSNAEVAYHNGVDASSIAKVGAGEAIKKLTLSNGSKHSGNVAIGDGEFHIQDGAIVSGGEISLTTDSSKLSFTSETADLVYGGKTVGSKGEIIKNGAKNVILTNDNSGYTGKVTISNGSFVVDANSANAKYFGGESEFNPSENEEVVVETSEIGGITQSGSGTTVVEAPEGTALAVTGAVTADAGNLGITGQNVTFEQSVNVGTSSTAAAPTVQVVGADTVNFEANVDVATGTLQAAATSEVKFAAPVTVGSANQTGTLEATAKQVVFGDDVHIINSEAFMHSPITTFNSNLLLNNASLYAAGVLNVAGNMTVGSTVDVMNGRIDANNIGGDLNVGTSGTAEFAIDIDPANSTSDTFNVAGNVTTTNPKGIIKVSDFEFLSAPQDREFTFKPFNVKGTVDPNVSFEMDDISLLSPVGEYKMTSLGNGAYNLGLVSFNQQIYRPQVAITAAYANQLVINNTLFDHIGEYLLIDKQLKKENSTASAGSPLFSPYQYRIEEGGIWYKGFGSLETIGMSQNLDVRNTAYGAMVGADFPVKHLKNGVDVFATVFGGYNGSAQNYGGTETYQNGGFGGVMGTLMKGNFFSSLALTTGGLAFDSKNMGTKDSFGSWYGSVASKSAYNINLPKDFVLQPSFLLSYTVFTPQNYTMELGQVPIKNDAFNAINVAPGVNLIWSKKTFSLYATTQYVFNIMGHASAKAGNIELPEIYMPSYFEYGVGMVKRFKDRFSSYGQITVRNGGRTGISLQGGLRMEF